MRTYKVEYTGIYYQVPKTEQMFLIKPDREHPFGKWTIRIIKEGDRAAEIELLVDDAPDLQVGEGFGIYYGPHLVADMRVLLEHPKE